MTSHKIQVSFKAMLLVLFTGPCQRVLVAQWHDWRECGTGYPCWSRVWDIWIWRYLSQQSHPDNDACFAKSPPNSLSPFRLCDHHLAGENDKFLFQCRNSAGITLNKFIAPKCRSIGGNAWFHENERTNSGTASSIIFHGLRRRMSTNEGGLYELWVQQGFFHRTGCPRHERVCNVLRHQCAGQCIGEL